MGNSWSYEQVLWVTAGVTRRRDYLENTSGVVNGH